MKAAARPTASVELTPNARRTLMRTVILPSWAIVAVLTVLFATGLKVSEPVQYAPFVLSLVFFGLPHGAVDHLVPGRLRGRVTIQSIVGVAVLYATLAAAYLTFWSVAPVAAFGFFILLTWFHWGQGDLYSQIAFLGGQYPAPVSLKVLMVVVRGGLPMLIPLLAFPDVYREVAGSIVSLFSGSGGLTWVFNPLFRFGTGSVFLTLVLCTFIWSYRSSGHNDKTAWTLDAAEVGLLAAYFALVPPILALGLYFCLWHATRHIARLMLLNPRSCAALQKGAFLPALRDFARDAAPLTVVALALLVGFYLLAPGSVQGLTGFLAVYLILISVLTLPHVVVVALMDRRQGLWR
jgi:Brp/Blh family beta-carotene 15,15'-monooxygenase